MKIKLMVADLLEEMTKQILQNYYVNLNNYIMKTYGRVNEKKIDLIIKKADITLKRQIEFLRTGKRDFLSGMSETDFAQKCLIPKAMSQLEIDRAFKAVELFSYDVIYKLCNSIHDSNISEVEDEVVAFKKEDGLLSVIITLIATFYEDLWISTIAYLKHDQEINEQLFSDMLKLHEKERKKLFQLVSNEINESMTLMKSRLFQLSLDQKLVNEILVEIDNLEKMSLSGIKSVFFDLSESDTSEGMFVYFLQNYLTDFQGKTGIAVKYDFDEMEHQLCRQLWVHLFRIIQESLNNVRNHSQAKQISVRLKSDEEQIALSIHDDGVGFVAHKMDYSAGSERLPFGKYGLAGMEQRAKMLGGKFTVTSKDGLGTTVTVILPIQKKLPFSKKKRAGLPDLVVILELDKRNHPLYFELENKQIFRDINYVDVTLSFNLSDEKIINTIVSLQPKVIILDLDFISESIKGVREIRLKMPFAVILAVIADTDRMFKVMEAGADSVILYDTPVSHSCDIIEAASHGYVLNDLRIQKSIHKDLLKLSELKSVLKMEDPRDILTEREREIISLVEEGFSNKEIAKELYISLSTVKASLANIYDKLGCSNRTETVARLRQGPFIGDKLFSEK